MISISHTKMSGGSFRLDAEAERKFHVSYAKLTKLKSQNHQLTWVERITWPRFRMFFDLDIHIDVCEVDVRGIADKIVRAMPRDSGTWLLSVPSQASKEKVGMHLNSSSLIVDQKRAHELVRIAQEATGLGGEIDTKPYNKGGLRMLWSVKREGGSYYQPVAKFDGVQWVPLDESVVDRESLIRTYSIRYIDEGVQRTDYESAQAVGPGLQSALERWIRVCWNIQLRILEIKKWKEHDSLVVKTDSRMCMNKGSEHRGNHIFFVISKHSGKWCIHQRCNSDHGTCANYKSQPMGLSHEIIKQLKLLGLITNTKWLL